MGDVKHVGYVALIGLQFELFLCLVVFYSFPIILVEVFVGSINYYSINGFFVLVLLTPI